MRPQLQIAANTRYQLWVNGSYIGQGPCPAPKQQSIVDSFDITGEECLTIAVLVHYYGLNSQSHSNALPGLWAQVALHGNQTQRVISIPPDAWKYCSDNGWRSTQCRRSWATGWAEQYYASEYPEGWQSPDFNDRAWPSAKANRYSGYTLHARVVPMLKEWFMPAEKLISVAEVSATAPFPEDGSVKLGQILDTEDWKQLPIEPFQSSWSSGAGITTPSKDRGLALVFDLGVNVSAQIQFQASADMGSVDGCGAERLIDERPQSFLKGADYACRWHAAENASAFRTINYNGFRYLLIVLRPAGSTITLSCAGAWRRQSDISLTSSFSTDDEELARLWQKSIHTIEIGTQETGVDCPTREQAFYIGDGLWHCLWLSKLYNEPSHLHHFFDAVVACQHDETGLVSPAIYRAGEPYTFLLDYCLIYVWGIDVYRRAVPVDQERLHRILQSGERVLKWFEQHINTSGLLEVDPHIEASGGTQSYTQLLFIDHPGMGWHMKDEPGIHRSQQSLGLNAYLIIALQAFYQCAESTGYRHCLDKKKLCTAKLRDSCQNTFWNTDLQYFADCIDSDGMHKGWSEHSQCLAVLANLIDTEEAHDLMSRLIQQRSDASLCKGTPYMWIYHTEALYLSGHGDKAIDLIREAWSDMNNNPAVTTWWETFLGDELDSFCHPWSAVPAWVLHNQSEQFRILSC